MVHIKERIRKSITQGPTPMVPVDLGPVFPKQPLTTMVVDTRCEGCPWPKVCEVDRTCWREEARVYKPPVRKRVDVKRTRRRPTDDEVILWIQEYVKEHDKVPSSMDMLGYCWKGGNWADLVKRAGFKPRRGRAV